MTVFLVLAAFGFGCWIGARDMRKRWNGWKPYEPSTNPLRDYK